MWKKIKFFLNSLNFGPWILVWGHSMTMWTKFWPPPTYSGQMWGKILVKKNSRIFFKNPEFWYGHGKIQVKKKFLNFFWNFFYILECNYFSPEFYRDHTKIQGPKFRVFNFTYKIVFFFTRILPRPYQNSGF